MKNILVTGAAGFIGYHVSKRLCSEGYEVIGVDNLNNYYDTDLKKNRLQKLTDKKFTFYKLDINDPRIFEIFTEHQIDRVVHLAAQAGVRYSLENPKAYADSNLSGFVNVLDASVKADVEKFIYASSSSVYGLNKKVPFKEDDATESIVSLYAATKRSNEIIADAYSKLYSLQVIGLRFFTVYGPFGRPDMAYFKFTDSILKQKEIEVFNDGELYRDFTHIDDIVDGVFKVQNLNLQEDNNDQKKMSQLFNIGRGKPIKLLDFINELEVNLNMPAKKKYVSMQAGDVYKTYADITKLNNFCGYQPKVDFGEGIRSFVDWYMSYYRK